MAKYNTPKDRRLSPDETGFSPSKVSIEGYLPAKIQIERLINAGQRLNEWRRDFMFAMNEEVPEDNLNPLISRNLDITDIDAIGNSVAKRIRDVEKRMAEKKAEKIKAENNEKVVEEKK